MDDVPAIESPALEPDDDLDDLDDGDDGDDVPERDGPGHPPPVDQLEYRAYAGFGGFGGLSGGGGMLLGGEKLGRGKVLRLGSGGTLLVPFDNDAFFGATDVGVTTFILIPEGTLRIEPFSWLPVFPSISVGFGYALVLPIAKDSFTFPLGIGQAITVAGSLGAVYPISDRLHLDASVEFRPIWLDLSQQPSTLTTAEIGLRF